MQLYLTPRRKIIDGNHQISMPTCPPPPCPSREEFKFDAIKTSPEFGRINDNNETTDEVLSGFFLLHPSQCVDSLMNNKTMTTTNVVTPRSKLAYYQSNHSQGQRRATIKKSFKLMPRPAFRPDNNFGDDLPILSMATPRAISLKPRASPSSRGGAPKTKAIISPFPCLSTMTTMAAEASVTRSMESNKRRRVSDDIARDANQDDKTDDCYDRDAIITIRKVHRLTEITKITTTTSYRPVKISRRHSLDESRDLFTEN